MTKDLKTLTPFILASGNRKKITLKTDKKVFALYKSWNNKRGGLIVNSESYPVTVTVILPNDFSGELKLPLTGGIIKAGKGKLKIELKALGELYFEY